MSRESKLDMRQVLLSLAATSVLLACGSDAGEHVGAATLMGGALGVPAGPVGVVAGAGIGAAAGALIPEEFFEGSQPGLGR
jgi:hypothetical protein